MQRRPDHGGTALRYQWAGAVRMRGPSLRLADDLRAADLLDVVDDVEDVADGAALVGDGSVADLLGVAALKELLFPLVADIAAISAVTDLSAEQATPAEIAAWARDHWTIENSVH
ncbi:hypothetical protein ACF1BE_31105 [Streptomyces sp. NPDC014991]|uniref:hypothetical protein n=1 Tax=Streptomyces sp. NPDC014991 TaxID=3364935 RepID=UPI0036FC8343